MREGILSAELMELFARIKEPFGGADTPVLAHRSGRLQEEAIA